jgi:hypothetical protein
MEGTHPEFGALFGLEKGSRAEENLLTWIRPSLQSLCFPWFAMPARWVISNIRRTLRVESHLQDGQAAIYSVSFHRAQIGLRAKKTDRTFSSGRSGHPPRAQDLDKVAPYLIGDRKS